MRALTRRRSIPSRAARAVRPLVTCACLALSVAACEEELPPPTFRVTFSAVSDGEPLAGVRILADGSELGVTGPEGTLGATLQGREGQTVPVTCECPEGHRLGEPPPLLTLRSFRGVGEATAGRGLEMTLSCPPAERLAAVVVRASSSDGSLADLPVLYRGRERARTDEHGVAHLLMRLEPNATFRIELDTSGRDNLQPQSPGQTFTVPDRDQIFTFDQPFQVKQRRRPRARRPEAPMGPTLPMRID